MKSTYQDSNLSQPLITYETLFSLSVLYHLPSLCFLKLFLLKSTPFSSSDRLWKVSAVLIFRNCLCSSSLILGMQCLVSSVFPPELCMILLPSGIACCCWEVCCQLRYHPSLPFLTCFFPLFFNIFFNIFSLSLLFFSLPTAYLGGDLFLSGLLGAHCELFGIRIHVFGSGSV